MPPAVNKRQTLQPIAHLACSSPWTSTSQLVLPHLISATQTPYWDKPQLGSAPEQVASGVRDKDIAAKLAAAAQRRREKLAAQQQQQQQQQQAGEAPESGQA